MAKVLQARRLHEAWELDRRGDRGHHIGDGPAPAPKVHAQAAYVLDGTSALLMVYIAFDLLHSQLQTWALGSHESKKVPQCALPRYAGQIAIMSISYGAARLPVTMLDFSQAK